MQRYFFGFNFDYEEGKLITNRQEMDMLEFIGKLSVDPGTQPPYHMLKSIMLYHNNEITRTDAIAMCKTKKYIMMYCNALCRKKDQEIFGIEPQEPSPTEPPKTPSVAIKHEHPSRTFRNMFIPPDSVEFPDVVDLQTEPWVGIKEVAQCLDASIDMVLICIRNYGLPAEKMGGVWYFKFSEVAKWWHSIDKEIAYIKLFKLMIDEEITGKELIRLANLSSSTLYRMKSFGGPVKNEVMYKICKALQCEPKDIYSFVPKQYFEKEVGS